MRLQTLAILTTLLLTTFAGHLGLSQAASQPTDDHPAFIEQPGFPPTSHRGSGRFTAA